ncbi:MAG: AAA family ATPase, partial [Hyphomicrobiales bacterium]
MDSDLRNPNGRLERLFMDDEKRSAFQKAVFDGIGQYPVIDPVTSFGSGSLRLVFSTEKPSEKFEKTIGQEFISYIDRSTPAGNVSDGYNAYVGMLGAIYSSDNQAVLIDEPEAFLHPTLARSLGRQIARRAANMHVFVATHSSDFLMGAIEAGVDVRIVRLQFNEGVATACLLDSSDLDSFMTDPLLRSSNVMSGLFSKFVIVAEADSDRAFYQEINARLVSSKDARGIDGTVFLNAQNKHTVRRIVGMLRRMGVPTLGVLDLDFVSDGGQNWSALADSLRIPSAMKQSLEIARKVTFDNLRKISTDDDRKNYKTKGGMDLLQNGEREAAEEFLSSLFRYGLAVVPIGEVEAWLGDLEVSRGKRSWLNDIFDKMGAKLSS